MTTEHLLASVLFADLLRQVTKAGGSPSAADPDIVLVDPWRLVTVWREDGGWVAHVRDGLRSDGACRAEPKADSWSRVLDEIATARHPVS